MEKIKKLITSVDFILTMFVLIGLRSVVVGSGIGDALALFTVASLMVAYRYLDMKRTPDINLDLRHQLEEMKGNIAALAMGRGMKETVSPVREAPKEMKRWF